MLEEVFKTKILNGVVVMPNKSVVPYDKFKKIFYSVKDNPTYENMMEINTLEDEKERGYSEFLNQCKEQGILN